MSAFTLQEVLEATGGELHQFVATEMVKDPSMFQLNGVSSDTRTIEEGNLYLALIGEKFDGNKFAVAAVEDGAKALLLSSMEDAPEDVPVVLVKDTKLALEQLATYYRKRLACQVIAVTGSVGKTSTRQMIVSALSRCCRVFATSANKNNEIGLSQTILSAPEDTEVLVLEMGMRGRGEISELTHIALPNIAVITNIGVAHIERLGSREEIRNAKLEIIEGLEENGLLILPYHDEYLQGAVKDGLIRSDVKIAYTSTTPETFTDKPYGFAMATKIDVKEEKIFFNVQAGIDQVYEVPLMIEALGLHHVGNALAGLICGLYYHYNLAQIAEGIASFNQVGHRERKVDVDGVIFIDDSYNAGPESMMSAMSTLRRIAGEGKAYACVADMLELGHVADEKHIEIGNHAAKVKLDGLLVIGDQRENVKRGALSVDPNMDVRLFTNKTEMVEELLELLKPGDHVLLKASHSFEMHTIVEDYQAKVREGDEK